MGEPGYYAMECAHALPMTAPVCIQCMSSALGELLEWRTGKRRVFWRVRWTHPDGGPFGQRYADYVHKRTALQDARSMLRDWKLYRVTVRRKVKS